MKKANKNLAEIKSLLRQIKDKKLYPSGYAKIIQKELGLDSYESVYQVANGHRYNEEIADALLKMAQDNKMKRQIDLAKDILS